jgi:hypothetical protein
MRELADDLGATKFHVAMLGMYLGSAACDVDDDAGGVYYVDNHYAGMSVMPGVQREADDLRYDRSLVSR